jgi:hypothetical protein
LLEIFHTIYGFYAYIRSSKKYKLGEFYLFERSEKQEWENDRRKTKVFAGFFHFLRYFLTPKSQQSYAFFSR